MVRALYRPVLLCRTLGLREVGIYRRHARLDGAWKDCVIVEKLLGEAALDQASQAAPELSRLR